MSLISHIKAELNRHINQKTRSYSTGVSSVYSMTEIPKIIEKKNRDWVLYGEDNLYPDKLQDLLAGSAIHNSIVKTKTKMTAGDGFLINGANSEKESELKYDALLPETKEDYDLFLENRNDKYNMQQIIARLASDLQTFGAFAYELVWNKDFTRIATVKYVPVKNLRSGKYVNDKVISYWYSRDWSKLKDNAPCEIFSFDKNDKTNMNQIVYEKIGNFEYYGEPSYQGAMTWIQTDFKMGIYHLSNISNGMSPSMALKFYKVPADENEKQQILDDIRHSFVGPENTGKHMVFFSPNKDTAPDISPVATSGLDKQLLLLAELCDKKILTGHQLTSPLIVGISVSGQIGGNVELKTAWQIFDNVVIAYDRLAISSSIKRNVLDTNAIAIAWEINPFDPFKELKTAENADPIYYGISNLPPAVASKVVEAMSENEIRDLIGLPPLPGGDIPPTTNPPA